MVSGLARPTADQDQSELAELRDGLAKMTPRPRPLPPMPPVMAPEPPRDVLALVRRVGLVWELWSRQEPRQ